MEKEKLMNQKEVCEYLDISRSSLYRYRVNDGLPVVSEKPLRFKASEINTWLKVVARRHNTNGKK